MLSGYLVFSLRVYLVGCELSPNKAFKRDSQRLAVLVQSLAYVFKEQCLSFGGIALSPLNAALCERSKK